MRQLSISPLGIEHYLTSGLWYSLPRKFSKMYDMASKGKTLTYHVIKKTDDDKHTWPWRTKVIPQAYKPTPFIVLQLPQLGISRKWIDELNSYMGHITADAYGKRDKETGANIIYDDDDDGDNSKLDYYADFVKIVARSLKRSTGERIPDYFASFDFHIHAYPEIGDTTKGVNIRVRCHAYPGPDPVFGDDDSYDASWRAQVKTIKFTCQATWEKCERETDESAFLDFF